jgi:hypothetical protein
MAKARELYRSPNGDRWYLIRDASGEVFVIRPHGVVRLEC